MEGIRADDIPHIIGPVAKIGIGNACAEPQTLIEGLIKNKEAFDAIDIYGMIHYWTDRFLKDNLEETFKLNVFLEARYTVEDLKKGITEYIPCRYLRIPELFYKG